MKISLDWKSQLDEGVNHLETNVHNEEIDEELLRQFKILLETYKRYEAAKE